MKNILLSFIIPAYNVEKFLIDTLTSIIQEVRKVDFKEIEIVIVNDGSTDSTPLLAEEFIQEHNDLNIKLFSKENGGLSDARNYGIDRASGEYIWFFDADDLIGENSLETIVSTLKREKLDLLSFSVREIYENGKIDETNIVDKPVDKIVNGAEYISQYKREISACMFVFKRSLVIYNNLRFIKGVLSEDYDFTLRLYGFCSRISFLNIVAYQYIIRQGSLSRRNDEKYYTFHHNSMLQIIPEVSNFFESFSDKVYANYAKKEINKMKMIAVNMLFKSSVNKVQKLSFYNKFNQNNILEISYDSNFTIKQKVVFMLLKIGMYKLFMLYFCN